MSDRDGDSVSVSDTDPPQTMRRRGLPPAMRGMRAAFVFLTRIPLGGFPYQRRDFEWAAAYFPIVGAVIGALGALAYACRFLVGPQPAALLALGATVLATGAFHEDGLADTFDALGDTRDRSRIFEILKDSRIGSYGSVALLIVLGLRVTCLAQLDWASGARALIFANALGRLGPVWLVARLPYVSPQAHAKGSGISGAGLTQASVATACTLLGSALLVFQNPPSLLAVCIGFAVELLLSCLLGLWFSRRAGGVTGDFLGATEQLGETALLLVWLAVQSHF